MGCAPSKQAPPQAHPPTPVPSLPTPRPPSSTHSVVTSPSIKDPTPDIAAEPTPEPHVYPHSVTREASKDSGLEDDANSGVSPSQSSHNARETPSRTNNENQQDGGSDQEIREEPTAEETSTGDGPIFFVANGEDDAIRLDTNPEQVDGNGHDSTLEFIHEDNLGVDKAEPVEMSNPEEEEDLFGHEMTAEMGDDEARPDDDEQLIGEQEEITETGTEDLSVLGAALDCRIPNDSSRNTASDDVIKPVHQRPRPSSAKSVCQRFDRPSSSNSARFAPSRLHARSPVVTDGETNKSSNIGGILPEEQPDETSNRDSSEQLIEEIPVCSWSPDPDLSQSAGSDTVQPVEVSKTPDPQNATCSDTVDETASGSRSESRISTKSGSSLRKTAIITSAQNSRPSSSVSQASTELRPPSSGSVKSQHSRPQSTSSQRQHSSSSTKSRSSTKAESPRPNEKLDKTSERSPTPTNNEPQSRNSSAKSMTSSRPVSNTSDKTPVAIRQASELSNHSPVKIKNYGRPASSTSQKTPVSSRQGSASSQVSDSRSASKTSTGKSSSVVSSRSKGASPANSRPSSSTPDKPASRLSERSQSASSVKSQTSVASQRFNPPQDATNSSFEDFAVLQQELEKTVEEAPQQEEAQEHLAPSQPEGEPTGQELSDLEDVETNQMLDTFSTKLLQKSMRDADLNISSEGQQPPPYSEEEEH